MTNQKFKITNWKTYNDALRLRGNLTLWISDDAAASWYDQARGMPLRYTDTAITPR